MSTPAPTEQEQKQKAPKNRYAQSSVIFGIVAMLAMALGRQFTLFRVIGLLASLASVGTGVMGYRAAQELIKGRNWAITGIVIGGIALLVFIVQLV